MMSPLSSAALIAATLVSLAQAAECSPPTSRIQWQPCQELNSTAPMLCGNVSVPLDYTDKNSTSKLTLELAKLSATKSPPQGSILLNFGGPGELDRWSMAQVAPDLLEISGGYFDLITFDTRGTGNALPFSCYASDIARTVDSLQVPTWGNASDVALGVEWSGATNFDSECYALQNETGSLIGTAFTARDMFQIVEALGENDGMLNYWGFSYGTTLGAITAAMFPDKIQRMVLDGVENSFEYIYGYDIEMYADADKTFTGLFEACVAAGPAYCALAGDNTTAAQIEEAVYNFLDAVKYEPIPYAGVLIDYNLIKSTILSILYSPDSYGELAAILADLMSGNVTAAADLFLTADGSGGGDAGVVDESLQGIKCSDKVAHAAEIVQVLPYIEQAYNISRLAGDKTSLIAFQCAQWLLPAKERYQGDFAVRTHAPILFVTNTHDPVAPARSAYNMSEAMEGSVVLEQDGFGHTSLAQPSVCKAKIVQSYFVNATLPINGTICPVDTVLFKDSDASSSCRRDAPASKEDQALSRAVRSLSSMLSGRRYRL